MENIFSLIQEYLHQRAYLHARLKLFPYDGSPEVKERDGRMWYERSSTQVKECPRTKIPLWEWCYKQKLILPQAVPKTVPPFLSERKENNDHNFLWRGKALCAETRRGVQVESEPERFLETLYAKTVPNNTEQKRFSYRDIFSWNAMKILVDFT